MIGDEIHGKLCREVGAKLELRVPGSIYPPYDTRRESVLALEDLWHSMPDLDKNAELLNVRVAGGDWGVTGNIPGRRQPVHKNAGPWGLYVVGDRSAPEG